MLFFLYHIVLLFLPYKLWAKYLINIVVLQMKYCLKKRKVMKSEYFGSLYFDGYFDRNLKTN